MNTIDREITIAQMVSYGLTKEGHDCNHPAIALDVLNACHFQPNRTDSSLALLVAFKHRNSVPTLEDAGRELAELIAHPAWEPHLKTNITRKDVENLVVKQIADTEGVVAKKLATHFRRSVRDTAQRIAGLEQEPAPERAAQQADAILNETFDAAEELEDLLLTMATVLPTVFAAGAMLEMSLGATVMKGEKTTAEEMVERLEIDASDLPFSIGELPQWLQDAARAEMVETFGEDYWQDIPQTTRGDIFDTMQDGIQEGWSMKRIAGEINRLHGASYSLVRGMRVARTEVPNALNAGHAAGISQLEQDTGLRIGSEWLSVLGSTTRLDHANMDGRQTTSANGLFNLAGHEIPWPAHQSLPAGQRINCQCHPGNSVMGGNISYAVRAWYSGNFTEVIASSGAKLSVSPQHPVMTCNRGMIAASELKEGDQLVRYDGPVDVPANGSSHGNHIEHKPTTASEIFKFLRSSSAFDTIEMCGGLENDFHGDGRFTSGKVQVISPHRKLRYKSELMSNIDSSHISLSPILVGSTSLASSSTFTSRSSRQGCQDGRSNIDSFPPSDVGDEQTFGTVSNMDAVFEKSSFNSHLAVSKFLGEISKSLPGTISSDEVVSIHSSYFNGYVYDFQGRNGITLADGYFVSNCTIISAIVMDALGEQPQDPDIDTFAVRDEATALKELEKLEPTKRGGVETPFKFMKDLPYTNEQVKKFRDGLVEEGLDPAKDFPQETLKVKEFIATQKDVDKATIKEMLKDLTIGRNDGLNAGGFPTDLPLIVRKGGINFIQDGHHRLVAKQLRGVKKARTYVVDLDE